MELIKSSGRRLRRFAQGQDIPDKDVHRSGSLETRRIGTQSTLTPYNENEASFMDVSVVARSPVHCSMMTHFGKERGLMPDDLATLHAQNRDVAATQTFPPPHTNLFKSQPLHKPAVDEQLPIEAPPSQLRSDIDDMAVLNGLAQRWEGEVENEAPQVQRGGHEIALASCERNKHPENCERPSRLVLLNELHSTMAAGENRVPQAPMQSKRSIPFQVQTSQAEILGSEMIQIYNGNQVTKMQCHSGPRREKVSIRNDWVGSKSPTLKSSASTRDILVNERDTPQPPVTKTNTPSRYPVALERPLSRGTPPSSKKNAEKHTKHILPVLIVSEPCPPPTKPLPKVPLAATLETHISTYDTLSEANPNFSCEDSPTLGLYRHHIRQLRSNEHLLSQSRNDNSASKYEEEASTYMRKAIVNPAHKSGPENIFQLPSQSYVENSLFRPDKADTGVMNHQARYPSPNIIDTRINVTLQGERNECSNNSRQSSGQLVQWTVDHHRTKVVPPSTDEQLETPSLKSAQIRDSQNKILPKNHKSERMSNSQRAIEAIPSYDHRLAAIYENTQYDDNIFHREMVHSLQDRVSLLERQNRNLQAYILEALGLGTI